MTKSTDTSSNTAKEAVFPGVGQFYKHKLSGEVVQVEFVESFHTVFYHIPGSSAQKIMSMDEFGYTFEPTDDPNKKAADAAAQDAEKLFNDDGTAKE